MLLFGKSGAGKSSLYASIIEPDKVLVQKQSFVHRLIKAGTKSETFFPNPKKILIDDRLKQMLQKTGQDQTPLQDHEIQMIEQKFEAQNPENREIQMIEKNLKHKNQKNHNKKNSSISAHSLFLICELSMIPVVLPMKFQSR